MCRPASFVVTKDKAFWSKTQDSHEQIIAEHKLHADGVRGANIARVEITPPDNNFAAPIDQWVYRLDQDNLPPWYDAKTTEQRVREELPAWIASKIILPGEKRDVKEGECIVAAYGTIQSVYGGTIQYVYGGTIQSVEGGTIQYVEGGTIQSVYGGTIQSVRGGTIQYVYGGTIQYVYGGTIQSVYGGTIQYVRGGTIQYVRGGTIQYVYGGTIQSVEGGTIQSVYGGTIQYVYGGTIQYVEGGTIQYVRGACNIIAYTTIDPAILAHPGAVLIDRSGGKIVVHVGPPVASDPSTPTTIIGGNADLLGGNDTDLQLHSVLTTTE